MIIRKVTFYISRHRDTDLAMRKSENIDVSPTLPKNDG